jgi:hypothetical protein
MCVKNIIILDGNSADTQAIFDVDGSSYHPEGKVHGLERLVKSAALSLNVKRFC